MTVDNLLKRNIVKPPHCRFYNEDKSINHLFYECVVAVKIWVYLFHFTNVRIENYWSTSLSARAPARAS
jgi:hypothetical protein